MNRRDFLKVTAVPLFISAQNAFSMQNLNLLNPTLDLEKIDIFEELSDEQNGGKDIYQDVFLESKYIKVLSSIRNKLKKIQSHVGYGNFNLISFDEIIKLADYISSIGSFTKEELDFFEYIFYYDPSIHGFYGQRISKNLTDKIDKNDVVKVSGTGHYLFKGHSHETYNRMLSDIGQSMVLTSGIRSIVKQSKLFLDKLANCEGNMSEASKSLAPPAYTYHTIADFDVGKKGFGYANFTPRFALTQEFIKMRSLKYIDMRYTINNRDGVRYEPWHVKVI
ncbi:hypothetical protein CRV08_15410 [Halarcobacter ebronensis]|uniref:D-alanyl-D-alanine carboxypeptidase-like core domain-containing protein n=1 Tax=Halarcobacter ebronensis TaxID=1462615 RepID=A0A4Q0Y5C3_9BACT|nr:M15 family metallopeptidase [Halarcobacter ebronensis]RXJ65376.1 hypothetical protein CRV08_15410 [Halarcobacter ebronensis]